MKRRSLVLSGIIMISSLSNAQPPHGLHIINTFHISGNAQENNYPFANNDTTVLKQQDLNQFEGFNKINKQSPAINSLIIPAVLISYGVIALESDLLKQLNHSTKMELREDQETFITNLDNYMQYAPAMAVYGLNAVGVKGKSNFRDRTMIYALLTVVSTVTVCSIKKITNVERPDASGNKSFPSGHTTTAFAAAEFLQQEFKDVSPWYGIAGYTIATATGTLRLYNNKHWVSDVVAGAGLGIISTKVAYWIYPSLKRILKGKKMKTMKISF